MSVLSVETDVAVPAAGGITLASDIVRPAGPGRYPTVVMRTAYDRTTYSSVSLQVHALRLAEDGYAVVLQDVRGRFGSGGDFAPFVNEQADGVATLEWVASQAWNSGETVMAGISYNAFNQVAAASAGHPSLAAIVPGLAPADVRTSWIRRGGALDLGFHLSWALGTIATLDRRSTDRAALLAAFEDVAATAEIGTDQPALAATPAASWFFDWAAATDPYPGDGRVPDEAAIGAVTVPALVVAGWHDVFAEGSFRLFEALGDGARIVAGPWDHSGLPLGRRAGDRDFGRRAALDLHQLQREWFDVHVRGLDAPGPPASLFVTGADEWVDLDSWPPPGSVRRYSLQTDGALGDVASPEREVQFVVDPDAPTPVVGGRLFPWEPMMRCGAFEISGRARRDDVVTFTSEPVGAALRVMGPAAVELAVSPAAGIQQFTAVLGDVHPDGSAWNVADGVVEADDAATVVDLGVVAHEFRPGHRIRVEVAGAAWPRYLVRPGRRVIRTGRSSLIVTEVA